MVLSFVFLQMSNYLFSAKKKQWQIRWDYPSTYCFQLHRKVDCTAGLWTRTRACLNDGRSLSSPKSPLVDGWSQAKDVSVEWFCYNYSLKCTRVRDKCHKNYKLLNLIFPYTQKRCNVYTITCFLFDKESSYLQNETSTCKIQNCKKNLVQKKPIFSVKWTKTIIIIIIIFIFIFCFCYTEKKLAFYFYGHIKRGVLCETYGNFYSIVSDLNVNIFLPQSL